MPHVQTCQQTMQPQMSRMRDQMMSENQLMMWPIQLPREEHAHKTRQEEKNTEDAVPYQRHCIDSCPEALALDLPQRNWC